MVKLLVSLELYDCRDNIFLYHFNRQWTFFAHLWNFFHQNILAKLAFRVLNVFTSIADKILARNALLNSQIEVTRHRIDLQEIAKGLSVRHSVLLGIS